MSQPFYRGRSALITGASSGIGEAFARALAVRGMSLLLAARSEERLRALAGELTARWPVRVEVVRTDLQEPDAPARLQAAADGLGFEPDLLVNNAGFGVLGTFGDVPLAEQLEMIQVNVAALVGLTGLYLPRMLARRSGAIVNLSSLAGLQPLPHFAVYAATKAFVLSFSEALWAEHRGRGVRIVAVCPGPVADTRFDTRANAEHTRFYQGGRGTPREVVVEAALRGLERDRRLVIPGRANALAGLAARLAPRRLQLTLTERMFRPQPRP